MKGCIGCLAVVLIVGVLGAAGAAPPAIRPAPDRAADAEIGRYQLFQGTYTSFDLKRQQTSTQSGIFLLDTRTGQVKRYLNKIDEEGRYIETWVPTEKR